MNWITNYVRPKISSLLATREVPENLWIKCPETGEMVFHKDLEANQWVVPTSGYHMRIRAEDRLDTFFDKGDYELIELPRAPSDPLRFRDSKRYTDRLRENRTKTEMNDAILVARGKVDGLPLMAIVQDFAFMGGSLGMAAGEAIVKGFDTAREEGLPVVLFAASGGARMQEGILSLMQMPRTTVALDRLKEEGLPYIVVLTNPTAGGVSASYAMLGDVHLAEPGAIIGFAGARVIEQTIRERLPQGFQRSEYLMEHGMVDMVVHRHELKATIARLLKVFTHAPADLAEAPDPEPESDDEAEPAVLTAEAPEAEARPADKAADKADRPGKGESATTTRGGKAGKAEKAAKAEKAEKVDRADKEAAQAGDGERSKKRSGSS